MRDAQLSMVAVELLGAGVTSRHHGQPFGDARIGLSQPHAVLSVQSLDCRIQQLGVGWEADVNWQQFDLTDGVWLSDRVLVSDTLRLRSSSAWSSALHQGTSVSAFCRSTSGLDVVSPLVFADPHIEIGLQLVD